MNILLTNLSHERKNTKMTERCCHFNLIIISPFIAKHIKDSTTAKLDL